MAPPLQGPTYPPSGSVPPCYSRRRSSRVVLGFGDTFRRPHLLGKKNRARPAAGIIYLCLCHGRIDLLPRKATFSVSTAAAEPLKAGKKWRAAGELIKHAAQNAAEVPVAHGIP